MTTYRVVVEGPCEHGFNEKHHPAHGACPGAVIGGYTYCGGSRYSNLVCEGVERFEVPGQVYVGPITHFFDEGGTWIRPDDFAEAVININKGAINMPEER